MWADGGGWWCCSILWSYRPLLPVPIDEQRGEKWLGPLSLIAASLQSSLISSIGCCIRKLSWHAYQPLLLCIILMFAPEGPVNGILSNVPWNWNFPWHIPQLLPPRCIFGKFNQCYIVGQIGKLANCHICGQGGRLTLSRLLQLLQ